MATIGKFKEAIKDFDEFLAVNNDDANVLCFRGNARYWISQREAGRHDFERALQLDPKCAPAHAGLAGILANEGKVAESVIAIQVAIRLDPKYPLAYFIKGQISIGMGDADHCLLSINKFLELSPNNNMGELPYFYRGVALRAMNRTEEALSSLLMARKLNPSSAEVAIELAHAFEHAEKLNLACYYAEISTTLDPKMTAPRFFCAKYYYLLGNRTKAKDTAERFFALTKNEKGSFGQRGELFALAGDYSQALVSYDKAIASGNYHAIVSKASLLATCPDGKIRDGAEALRLAKAAFEDRKTRDWSRWPAAMALGEAYAEMGEFDLANYYADVAVGLAGADYGGRQKLLEKALLFSKKTPYRMQSAGRQGESK